MQLLDLDLFGEPVHAAAAPRLNPTAAFRAELRAYRAALWVHTQHATPVPAIVSSPVRERVVLIGCGKAKLAHAAPARDLYTGSLFRARRRFAEASGLRWWIVSAKHGLLDPGQVIEPYDVMLGDCVSRAILRTHDKVAALAKWGQLVAGQLRATLPDKIADIELHAGAEYITGLRAACSLHIGSITTPTVGMMLGKQLHFYSQL